jgi:hypothetical protein
MRKRPRRQKPILPDDVKNLPGADMADSDPCSELGRDKYRSRPSSYAAKIFGAKTS